MTPATLVPPVPPVSRAPTRAAPGEAGFSLLELMVALAILSLGATALVRLNALSARTAADLSARAMAQITADAAAARIATDPAPPTIGTKITRAVNGGVPLTIATLTAATADPAVVTVAIRVSTPGSRGGPERRGGDARRLVVRRVAP